MSLDASELIRRFLMHVPPSGFVRIRHFGFLANRVREQKLKLIHALLGVPRHAPTIKAENHDESAKPEQEPRLCPVCKIGRLISVAPFEAGAIISPGFMLQDTS